MRKPPSFRPLDNREMRVRDYLRRNYDWRDNDRKDDSSFFSRVPLPKCVLALLLSDASPTRPPYSFKVIPILPALGYLSSNKIQKNIVPALVWSTKDDSNLSREPARARHLFVPTAPSQSQLALSSPPTSHLQGQTKQKTHKTQSASVSLKTNNCTCPIDAIIKSSCILALYLSVFVHHLTLLGIYQSRIDYKET